MCLQYPGISQSVAVVEHHLKMTPAEACPVGPVPDIGFHVGGAAAQDKIQQILLYLPFHKAERALIVGVYRVV